MSDNVILPILALVTHVFLPTETIPITVGRVRSSSLITHLGTKAEKSFVVMCQSDPQADDPGMDELHPMGVLSSLIAAEPVPKTSTFVDSDGVSHEVPQYTAVVAGHERMRLVRLLPKDDSCAYLQGEFERVEETFVSEDPNMTEEVLFEVLQDTGIEVISGLPDATDQMVAKIKQVATLRELTVSLMVNSPLEMEARLAFLLETDLCKRAHQCLEHMSLILNKASMSELLKTRVREKADESQREYLLRAQLSAIRDQLGEGDEDLAELEERLISTPMSEEAREACAKQYKRLSTMQSSSSEYNVILTYLETMLDLPWGEYSEDNLDLERAREILDEEHYGLQMVKNRVVEYLAVRTLKQDLQGPIMCLHGPPGVGKTSIARSVADTMGRKFIRISLGGVHDESEIRGHRRTYVGALPGRIADAMMKAGTMNPVILLDEIDKVGSDFRGDPSAALLEVLDPAQNSTFKDHYLAVDLDLSKVLFIATANRMDTISPPLRDRMEVLDVPSYTLYEKVQIGQRYLFPKQVADHGMVEAHVDLPEEMLHHVIDMYTREAGVRGLNRRLADLCRNAAVEVALFRAKEDTTEGVHVVFDAARIAKALGPVRYISEVAQREDTVGVATGLAWTQVGGDILFIEVQSIYPGKGEVKLTGQLGDVMKESVYAALSYLRAHAADYKLLPGSVKKHDLHIHVPAGAIPKDGPSAGITMFSALLSRLTGVPIRHDLAMTGEITLTGQVLPVGGIKEKIIAAHRAGIREAIIPAICEKDLVDIDPKILDDMTFHYAKRVEELPQWIFPEGVWEAHTAPEPPKVPVAEESSEGAHA
jgi:ATP-dependent Lon protease